MRLTTHGLLLTRAPHATASQPLAARTLPQTLTLPRARTRTLTLTLTVTVTLALTLASLPVPLNVAGSQLLGRHAAEDLGAALRLAGLAAHADLRHQEVHPLTLALTLTLTLALALR